LKSIKGIVFIIRKFIIISL